MAIIDTEVPVNDLNTLLRANGAFSAGSGALLLIGGLVLGYLLPEPGCRSHPVTPPIFITSGIT